MVVANLFSDVVGRKVGGSKFELILNEHIII